MGNDTAGASRKRDNLVKTTTALYPGTQYVSQIPVQDTKSHLWSLDSSSRYLSVCIFSTRGLLIENELLTLVI